jgi:hypothetical protein
MAVDATGRQIVVPREEVLAPEDLDSQGVLIGEDTDPSVTQDKRPWHPVFLVGLDQGATPPPLGRGCSSNGTQPNRQDEVYQIRYGRPGTGTDEPPAVDVTDGPETTSQVTVLVGYVQWDATNNTFFDAKNAPTPQLTPTYAGVLADEVVARSGTLSIRANQEGATRKDHAAIVLDQDKDKKGELRFGIQDDLGVVKTVFRVTSAGDIWLDGVIQGKNVKRQVWMESGTVFDGMTVPLPVGVTQSQVDAGELVLHIIVTPRRTGDTVPPPPTSPPPGPGNWMLDPFECVVDGRRVFARNRWINLNTLAIVVLPAACDYLILASAAAGGSP